MKKGRNSVRLVAAALLAMTFMASMTTSSFASEAGRTVSETKTCKAEDADVSFRDGDKVSGSRQSASDDLLDLTADPAAAPATASELSESRRSVQAQRSASVPKATAPPSSSFVPDDQVESWFSMEPAVVGKGQAVNVTVTCQADELNYGIVSEPEGVIDFTTFSGAGRADLRNPATEAHPSTHVATGFVKTDEDMIVPVIISGRYVADGRWSSFEVTMGYVVVDQSTSTIQITPADSADFWFERPQIGDWRLVGPVARNEETAVRVDDVLNNVESHPKTSVRIVDAHGWTVSEDKPIGTGMRIELLDSRKQVLDSATIVVRGDLTGTGTTSLSQLVRAAKALGDADTLEDVSLEAGDINGSGKIDLSDLVLLAKMLSGGTIPEPSRNPIPTPDPAATAIPTPEPDPTPAPLDPSVDSFEIQSSSRRTSASLVKQDKRPAYAYLTPTASGFERVELTRIGPNAGKIVVERYDSNLECLGTVQVVEPELPRFGGFLAGTDANFLVFGQTNEPENDSVEVLRVVKYDKDWNRTDSASVYGGNIREPFAAGTFDAVERGKWLYIRAGHTMYKSGDGANHQKSFTLALNTETMEVVDDQLGGGAFLPTSASFDHSAPDFGDWDFSFVTQQWTNGLTGEVRDKDWNILIPAVHPGFGAGYTSHSFAQELAVDTNDQIVSADLGDAYPRAIKLTRYGQRAEFDAGARIPDQTIDILEIPGETGDNTTGVTLGGLEALGNGSYLCTYASSGIVDDSAPKAVYAVFVGPEFTEDSMKTIEVAGKANVDALWTVPKDADSGFILWREKTGGDEDSVVKFVEYRSDGTISSQHAFRALPSDCEPVYAHGKLVWYVCDPNKFLTAPTFCGFRA